MNSTSAGAKDSSASIRNRNGRPSCVSTAILAFAFVFCGCTARALFAKRKPSSQQFAMAHAELLLKNQHYRKAIKKFKHLNGQQGHSSADCFWGVAQGNWGLAQADWAPWQAYWRLQYLKRTDKSCDKVLKYAGWNVHLKVLAHNLKGLVAVQRGFAGEPRMFKEAEEEFQAAYILDKGYPDRPEALFNLGMAEIRAGETAKGVATLKNYLARNPHAKSAEKARRVVATPRLATVVVAPDFSLTATDGRTYSLQQLRGKIVLLDFWGVWCPYCRASVPKLVRLKKEFATTPFVMISISSDTDVKGWRQFIKKKRMDWPQYLDRNHQMQRTYGVFVFPTYVLVDQDGAMVLREHGASPENELTLQRTIKKELAALEKAKQETRPKPALTSDPRQPNHRRG